MKLLVAAASTKVQMNAKVAANGQYIGILKSNIPGFEQLEGKAMLKTNTPTEKTILFAASKNKVNLFKGTLGWKIQTSASSVQTTAQMDMEAGAIRQKLTLVFSSGPVDQTDTKDYTIKITTSGSQSNVDCQGTLAFKQTGFTTGQQNSAWTGYLTA